MKISVFLMVFLFLFISLETVSQTTLKEVHVGVGQTNEIKELINDFKKNLSDIDWEVTQAGYISYNKNNRYIIASVPGIEIVTLKTIVMGSASYQTCLKKGQKKIQESGKLFILKGVHRDILVLVNYSGCCGGESLDINLYNQKLEKLCNYSESGEELSDEGTEIYKLILEKPHKVIKWLSATECIIKSVSVPMPLKDESENAKLFEDFKNLFDDISMYLGDMDSFIFPIDYSNYNKMITYAEPIPSKFKKFINTENSDLDFCRNHLNENKDFYPVYKIKNGNNICLIMYYSVPEIPKNRVKGEYYFLFSYTHYGKFIDVYPLAFSGTEINSNDFSRYSKLWSLKNIRTITSSKIKNEYYHKEFITNSVVKTNGAVETGITKSHFEELPAEWVYAVKENNHIYAVQECDSWIKTINLIVDESLNFKVKYYTGQETVIYNVESLKTDPDTDEYTMVLTEGSIRLYVVFSYSDSENIAIKIKGLNQANPKETVLFADKNKADKGSIQIKKLHCDDGPP